MVQENLLLLRVTSSNVNKFFPQFPNCGLLYSKPKYIPSSLKFSMLTSALNYYNNYSGPDSTDSLQSNLNRLPNVNSNSSAEKLQKNLYVDLNQFSPGRVKIYWQSLTTFNNHRGKIRVTVNPQFSKIITDRSIKGIRQLPVQNMECQNCASYQHAKNLHKLPIQKQSNLRFQKSI